jgi:3D (Asp-Asp-Asp) domain-containing protein
MRFGKGFVMAQAKVISSIRNNRSLGIVGAFILTGVVFVCVVFPKIVFAAQAPTPPANTEIEAVSEQKIKSNTLKEQQLINSLMKDVFIDTQSQMIDGEYWETVRMRVTGYCPCSQCCGEFSDGITANNHRIQPGDTFVAADRSYRFGTKMVIPGYNVGRVVQVMDRGGAIKGNRLDLFFHTHQQALQWGVRHLDVLIKAE